jgi:NDP-sugar pyrophosphorylase family protein
MPLTLLVLAAGLGSRYGGLKQLDPVGPSGETLLDYSVYDAIRAGFDRVVFVIREEFAVAFRERIAATYARRVDVGYAFQSTETLPVGISAVGGRTRPWGTGHATWCAHDVVNSPFAVINADDFYGADSFEQLAKFLRAAPAGHASLVGFRLNRTLSEHGTVSRGICAVDGQGQLQQVVEHTGIRLDEVGPGRTYRGDEIVSMNCWGFRPEIFEDLEEGFRAFLQELTIPAANTPRDPTSAEYYLPAAVSRLVETGRLRVRALPTESHWFGVTYREDRPRVVAELARLIVQRTYPAKLF